MKRNDTNEYHSRILGLLAQLRDDVDRMAGVGAENASIVGGREPTRLPTHMVDIAGDAFDQECEFSLLRTKEEIVQQLEDALDRIDQGTYGICEECCGRISKTRLAAIPYATRCIKCASRIEHG